MSERLSKSEWLQIIRNRRHADEGPAIRRVQPRYLVEARALIRSRPDDNDETCALAAGDVVEVSAHGCMIRTDRELPERIPVEVQLRMGEQKRLVNGRVIHSTST